ncbi:replicative DNA helicase [Candidatus Saccharibacteria bacterium]|nr:replicative DNA helicase [Candidatus Saccharibacteria bacterium]
MVSRSNDGNVNGGRIPPQDINAEKSLLGAILLSDENFPDVLEKVKDADFYDKNNSLIYKAMTTLYNTHRPIDLLTLTSELRSEKNLKTVGGAPYLTELTNYVPTAANIQAYADIVADCATRRNLINTGTKIATDAYDESKKPSELVSDAEKELFSVSNRSTKSEFKTLSALTLESFDRLEQLKESGDAVSGLKTGFRDLDLMVSGLQNGDLVVVGARPGMGKTTIAQNIAYNAATINNAGVLFFSLEMSGRELSDRIVSDLAEIDSRRIRSGQLTDDEFTRVSDALSEMSEVPLYIEDTSVLTVLELRNRARRAVHDHKDDHPIRLIVIDYLQLISSSDRYAGNRVYEVTEISQNLKLLARELNLPVVALAQLSRNVTGRDDPRPVLSDLRDSGSIEQDADLVLMLHRPDYYNKYKEGYEETHIAELLVQKNRHGSLGKIDLYEQMQFSRFLTLDKHHTDEDM